METNEKLILKLYIPNTFSDDVLHHEYKHVEFVKREGDVLFDISSVVTLIGYLVGGSGITKIIVEAIKRKKDNKIKIHYRKEIGEISIDAENADKETIKEIIEMIDKLVEKK